jgi:hypothetical protein
MPRSSLMPMATARALVAIKQGAARALAHSEQAAEMLALILRDAPRRLPLRRRSRDLQDRDEIHLCLRRWRASPTCLCHPIVNMSD